MAMIIFGLNILFWIALIVIVIIAVSALYIYFRIQPTPLTAPTGFHAKRVKEGYLLEWNADPSVHSYDLFIFSSKPDDINDAHTHLLSRVNSGFIMSDSYLSPGETHLLLAASRYINSQHEISPPAYLQLQLGKSNLPAPVLKCFGGFDFEGQFQADAELCYQQSTDDRILLQWHPVAHANSYNVYSSKGPNVSISNSTRLYQFPNTTYYILSDVIPENECWSFTVTAIDDLGRETDQSQIFTTCQGP